MVYIYLFSDGGIICHECRDSVSGGLKYCGQEGVEEVETDCGQDSARYRAREDPQKIDLDQRSR